MSGWRDILGGSVAKWLSGVLVAGLTAVGIAVSGFFTEGGLIRFLGGVDQASYEEVQRQITIITARMADDDLVGIGAEADAEFAWVETLPIIGDRIKQRASLAELSERIEALDDSVVADLPLLCSGAVHVCFEAGQGSCRVSGAVERGGVHASSDLIGPGDWIVAASAEHAGGSARAGGRELRRGRLELLLNGNHKLKAIYWPAVEPVGGESPAAVLDRVAAGNERFKISYLYLKPRPREGVYRCTDATAEAPPADPEGG